MVLKLTYKAEREAAYFKHSGSLKALLLQQWHFECD